MPSNNHTQSQDFKRIPERVFYFFIFQMSSKIYKFDYSLGSFWQITCQDDQKHTSNYSEHEHRQLQITDEIQSFDSNQNSSK